MTAPDDKTLDSLLCDVILDAPRVFRANGRLMAVYPVTLAKTLRLGRLMPQLGVNMGLLTLDPMMEAVRLVGSSREVCTAILAIHTCPNTRKDFHDWKEEERRKKILSKLSDQDMATLLMLSLTQDKTDALMRHLGLDKEKERMARVNAAKEAGGSRSVAFGGKSVLGTFVAQLKEMGYDDDEIIYRRGYSYLRLMLADKVSCVYLTAEERSRLSEADGGTMIDGGDPASVAKLSEWLSKRGMTIN